MSQQRIYPVSEDEILRISKLVTSFESALKALLRRAGATDAHLPDIHQMEFCRHVSEVDFREDDGNGPDMAMF